MQFVIITGMPGSGMRIPGDHRPTEQCPLPELPQEDGDYQKRRRRDLCLRLRIQRKTLRFQEAKRKRRRRSIQKRCPELSEEAEGRTD